MKAKNILKSKTYWVNVLMAAAFPFLPDDLRPSPEVLAMIFAGVNIVLRKISHGKVELI
jgi:hypothetical protein